MASASEGPASRYSITERLPARGPAAARLPLLHRPEECRALAAAVDEERRAGDVARERRGEEEAGVADVARPGEAAEGDGRGDAGEARRVGVVEAGGVGTEYAGRGAGGVE